jgi:hypothetical protein
LDTRKINAVFCAVKRKVSISKTCGINTKQGVDGVNCKDIVRDYLKQNGYDGLCLPEHDCGCGYTQLAPCDEALNKCQPAYHHTINELPYFCTKKELTDEEIEEIAREM